MRSPIKSFSKWGKKGTRFFCNFSCLRSFGWLHFGERGEEWEEALSAIPSGYVKIAIENGPVEMVDFPIKNGDFP